MSYGAKLQQSCLFLDKIVLFFCRDRITFVNLPKKGMPTVFIFFGFRFMFYSNDHLPIHIHILKDGHEAKYNVEPLEMVYNHGFKKHDLLMIESVIEENKAIIIERWKDYFKDREES